MLVLYLFILMFTNSLNHLKKNIYSIFINRITILTLLVSILLTFNTLYFQSIGKGIGIYNGLFIITLQSHIIDIFLCLISISILLGWPNKVWSAINSSSNNQINLSITNNIQNSNNLFMFNQGDQYCLIAIFSIIGGSLLMSSLDLLSMYLSIELQSFALYILATLNKDKISATSAGLKYFLLGSLSSCFILLGSAIIYSYTGLTQLESINTLISIPSSFISNSPVLSISMDVETQVKDSVLSSISFLDTNTNNLLSLQEEKGNLGLFNIINNNIGFFNEIGQTEINKAFTIGLIFVLVGFLFKLSAAPFYQWAPDVYDGTPTIVTVWLTIIAKLTIFIFIQNLLDFPLPNTTSFSSVFNINNLDIGVFNLDISASIIKNFLLISSLLSLIVGTVAGLSQIKIKRLLAFSSVSHVGFLLLALGIYSQKSLDAFIFYLVQYSLTSLNIFLILLAFGYLINKYIYSMNINSNTAFGTLNNNNHEKYSQTSTLIREWKKEESISLSLKREVEEKNKTLFIPLTSALNSIYLNKEEKIRGLNLETDINYLTELKGQLNNNPILSFSLAICLFSMAGIPPLIGFFSKQFVLFSSIQNENNFLSIVAILVSVISASYYLKLIQITFFENFNKNKPFSLIINTIYNSMSTYSPTEFLWKGNENKNNLFSLSFSASNGVSLFRDNGEGGIDNNKNLISYLSSTSKPISMDSISYPTFFEEELEKRENEINNIGLSNIHAFIISFLTFMILFFFLNPSILLNGTQLISLTIFNL